MMSVNKNSQRKRIMANTKRKALFPRLLQLSLLASSFLATQVHALLESDIPLTPMFSDSQATGLAAVSAPSFLQPMSEGELQDVQGQALFVSNRIQGTGSIATGTSGVSFYRAGLDATLTLNANIKNLELGRTGPGNQVDLWAENMAFGCTANNLGNCVDSSVATQLKDFILERPYFEFAIRNDGSPTMREVVGIRLGAESAQGPLSVGNFRVFSGYLNATANIVLEGQGKNANGSANAATDIAITCGVPNNCPGSLGGTGRNTFGLTEPLRSLGLDNDQACVLGICAEFRDITVGYGSVSRNNLPVVASGKRQTQALISDARFYDATTELTAAGSLIVSRSNSALSAGLINFILGLIRGQATEKIAGQLYTNLGLASVGGNWNNTAAQRNILNNYQIPFNVSNLHQVDVDSPLFGFSFQKENLRFPGYVQNVPVGWGFYLPDAFTLTVSEPATIFVNNIGTGAAAAGNIIALPPVYDNCWGPAQFC
jgi:hypothetical protein